ncbi:MAG: glycosyltransferase [Desulfatiglans sp.]|jgi:glycosyltransferase involved in cell wall biosynthesis|nr:glycosyltransferase [Desulfatiglans sp.]
MISVIIPSYNSESTISKCLDALKNQEYRGEYEIILVDSSRDRTPEIVNSKYPDIQFIHLDKKTDPGTARNIGIEKSKGDLIAFIDSDCVAAPDWLNRIAAAHTSEYKVVGGSVRNGNRENDMVAWAGYLAEFREFLPGKPKMEVSHIPTCNISYKKEIFDKYGLFEGEYYPQEDLIFNYKICKNGEKILLDSSITVYHNHRSVMKSFLDHQMKIGKITSRVLKEVDLEGSFIVRTPLIAAAFIPVLPFIKFFRTIMIFLKYEPKVITRRPVAVIVFAVGLFFWIIGFASGVMYNKSISTGK